MQHGLLLVAALLGLAVFAVQGDELADAKARLAQLEAAYAKSQEQARAKRVDHTAKPTFTTSDGNIVMSVGEGKHVAIAVGSETVNLDELDVNMRELDAEALKASTAATLLGFQLGNNVDEQRENARVAAIDDLNDKLNNLAGKAANFTEEQSSIRKDIAADMGALKQTVNSVKTVMADSAGPPGCVPGIEYQVKAASTNAPAECAYISIQCPAGQYQTDAPTRTADRECTDWATCKDTEYQIARGTAYHDVQCSKVSDKCSDDELENTPPTKFADRECIPKNCETVPNGLVPGPNGPEYCANGVSTGGDGSSKAKAGKSCFTIRHGHQKTQDATYWVYLDSAKDPFQVYCDMVSCGRDESNEWKEKSGCGGWTLALKSGGADHPQNNCLNKKDTRWRQPNVMGNTANNKAECAKGLAYSRASFTDVLMRSLSKPKKNTAWRHTEAGESLHAIIGTCTRKHDGVLLVPGYIPATHNQQLTALEYLDWRNSNENNNHQGDKPRPAGLWHSTCTGEQRWGFFVADYDGGERVAGCSAHGGAGGGGVIGVANYNWNRAYTYEMYGHTTYCISAFAFGGGYGCACNGGPTGYQSHGTMQGHWWGHGGDGTWANAHGIFVRDIRDVPGKSLPIAHGEGHYSNKGGGHQCDGCRA